jgi:DNA-binding transcriptional regulator YdaS (Cro superfamily)
MRRILGMDQPAARPPGSPRRSLRIAFGNVAARMAEACGVSDQTVSWWLKGERDGRPGEASLSSTARMRAPHARARRAGLCEELRPDYDWAYLRMQAAPWDGDDRRAA